jgi:hypothetical protein
MQYHIDTTPLDYVADFWHALGASALPLTVAAVLVFLIVRGLRSAFK